MFYIVTTFEKMVKLMTLTPEHSLTGKAKT